jgi:hypothetical protein
LDEFSQRSGREIAVLVVDCFDARAVNRQQLAPEQIEITAQDHELPENLLEGGAICAPKIGDRLEVGLQCPHQPKDLNIAMTFDLETAARPDPISLVQASLRGLAAALATGALRPQIEIFSTSLSVIASLVRS